MKTCRCEPPKGYPKSRSKYADPACFLYRLDQKKYVRAAAARFSKYKRRYPPAVRAEMARRIDRAERRFGIGIYR